ncbi:MAG: hypothetical protein LBB89_01490 [Treponema sp.]|jgi:hypothetical protein|nr:hypothetical protein [Treponema sp.]
MKIDLSVELTKDNTIEIHGNNSGLKYLIKNIQEIIKNKDDHVNLLTINYGGELVDELYGINNKKINHIKIFNWFNNKNN